MRSQLLVAPERIFDIEIFAKAGIIFFTAMIRIPLGSTHSPVQYVWWLRHLHLRSFNFVDIQVIVSKHVGIVNHTSHPHVMDDGTVYNLGMSLSLVGPQYSIIKFPPHRDVDSASRYTHPI
jgi:hypothetical protein